MNIQAPSSFAACNGFVTLLKELEPNGEGLPKIASQAFATLGKDNRVAVAQICLKCKGTGKDFVQLRFHNTLCDNCNGQGAFITAQEITKGYFIGDTNGEDN